MANSHSKSGVFSCSKMEEIINEIKLGQVAELVGPLSPFAKLQTLSLWDLPEFKSIYWDVLPFSCMKVFHVQECPKETSPQLQHCKK